MSKEQAQPELDLENFSLASLDLDDIQELPVLDEGEYKVQCSYVDVRTSKNSNPYLFFYHVAVDHEGECDDIRHMIMLPSEDAGLKQNRRRRLELQQMCDAFGVAYDANPLDFKGKEAWADIYVEESEDYGKQNQIRKFVTGA